MNAAVMSPGAGTRWAANKLRQWCTCGEIKFGKGSSGDGVAHSNKSHATSDLDPDCGQQNLWCNAHGEPHCRWSSGDRPDESVIVTCVGSTFWAAQEARQTAMRRGNTYCG